MLKIIKFPFFYFFTVTSTITYKKTTIQNPFIYCSSKSKSKTKNTAVNVKVSPLNQKENVSY